MESFEKLRGLGEVLVGSTLITASFWGPMLDHIMVGLHLVAVTTGAVVGVHGVYRILRKKSLL